MSMKMMSLPSIYSVVAAFVAHLGNISRKMMSLLSTYSGIALNAEAGVGSENVGSFLLEKLRQLLHLLCPLPGFLQEKLDQNFPPETRSAKLHYWLVVALSLCCLYCCWKWCCCSRGGRGGRMMKAPGRPGRRMPRATFEANPKGYFRDLRAD